MTPAASHTAASTVPASLGDGRRGTELSFLICNFLPLPCPYFLLFTAVLEEFQEADLLSAFTDVAAACPCCSRPVSFGAQCPFPLPAPGSRGVLVPRWPSMPRRVPVFSGKVWHCGFLREKCLTWKGNVFFLLKRQVTKKAPGGRKPPPEVPPGGKACSGPARFEAPVTGTMHSAVSSCCFSQWVSEHLTKEKGRAVSVPECQGRNEARKS